MRRPPFNQSHEFRNPKLWINFAKQVNVLRHDLQLDDLALRFRCNLVNDLFKPSRNGVIQHLSPVFRTENDVILARIHDVSIRFILRLRRHISSIPRLAIYWQAGGCLISPGPEGRGGTALLLRAARQGSNHRPSRLDRKFGSRTASGQRSHHNRMRRAQRELWGDVGKRRSFWNEPQP